MLKSLLSALTLVISLFSLLQAAPSGSWEVQISAFEAADRLDYPPPGATVFIGSSSIRGWRSLEEDFRGMPVVNRGFGGSQMADAAYYVDRIVAQYRPLAVVVYEGDNDIAAGKSPQVVADDFRSFVAAVRSKLPVIPIYAISIKPSLARWEIWPAMKEANGLIEQICREGEGLHYIDVATPTLGADGAPLPDIFVEDGLHLNRKGYDIWTAAVKPFLEGKK